MKKRIEDLLVDENRRLNQEYYVIRLYSSKGLPTILPGQFAQVRVDGSPTTFLRRPVSIYSVNYQSNTLELLLKIVGDGTAKLATTRPGEKINLIYPLGNSFSIPEGRRVLLIGGGTGVAPLLLLGRYLVETKQIQPHFLLGFRSKELIIEKEKFSSLGPVHITTEDGSDGYKGFVLHHPVLNTGELLYDMIYTCGPEIMMEGVARIAKWNNIPCEVSLENLMGCGIGSCLCCVVDTVEKGNVNTCTEGPVFNSLQLKWRI